MKRIVSISLGSSARDYRVTTTLLGRSVEIERIGTDGSVARAAELLRSCDGHADAIGLGGLTPVFRVGTARYPHRQAIQIASQATRTPVVDGGVIKATLERWAIAQAARQLPSLLRYKRVLLTSGIERYQLAAAIDQYEPTLRFADPLIHIGLPNLPPPRSLAQLELYAATTLPITALLPYRILYPVGLSQADYDPRLAPLFQWADVIAGDFAFIRRFAPPDLSGKSIITDDPAPAELEDLRQRGVTTLVTMMPPLSAERPFMAADVLEALVTALQEAKRQPGEAEVLDFIAAAGWGPTVQQLNPRPRPKFAFVIHPLRTSLIANHPRFRWTRHLPERLVERMAAYMPPLYVSKIRGIRSTATGEEAEGFLLSLGTTPREMMRREPSFTYRRLIRAARMAERMGAHLMGLGAFTSVVGDAGITVAQKATIGITSGNSLTVAATLEAAKQAVILMKGGRPSKVRAVVIGATGSIGAVCARLLAQAVGDVVLIAPRPERLLALKQQIEAETPGARVIAATHPDAYIGEADLIITTTSSLTGNVVNVDKLKPGAVICDVARPPDVKPADAARRPDVLIVESGEIVLPGEPDFGVDIDMPPGTAYACLSETALLAMEGMFEDYTLGRNIEMERVKEMYRLWHKHGLKLAGLRSFGVYVTGDMISEKRRLAAERRRHMGLPQEEVAG
ncbi:serine carboxypeptidase [Candidatus Viridilinea mediisalina]|uniref:Serine carboxypeptidase n=1 Tax=Candidatus Viridilinea mediisalina TaxID=2024553 RepID=A0A2A6RJ49_9CHLR|nr:serine carboxypeptidase [Candidatus Viridilinea mediisalina]PDW03154.1 serine carboxypeptidase [Candidatus Viridilinea mediisalina]